MARALTEFQLKHYQNAGEARNEIEQALLLLMFRGFSHVRAGQGIDEDFFLLESVCNLGKYTRLVAADIHPSYSTMSDEVKRFYHTLVALEQLKRMALVKRRVLFSSQLSPEDGYVDLEGKLDGSEASELDWLAFGIATPHSRSFSPSSTQ